MNERVKTKVSVLIPIFNKRGRLPFLLSSLVAQKDKDFILIMSDNWSNDGSFEYMSECLCKITCSQKILYQPPSPSGASENFLGLLDKVETPFFLFLDAEDELSDNYIAEINDALVTGDQYDLAVPSFFEYSASKNLRRLTAFDSWKGLPVKLRLPALAVQSNNMGVGYLIYGIYRTAFASSIFRAVLATGSTGIEDMAIAYAVAHKSGSILYIDNIALLHYSRADFGPSRKIMNSRAVSDFLFPCSKKELALLHSILEKSLLFSPSCLAALREIWKVTNLQVELAHSFKTIA